MKGKGSRAERELLYMFYKTGRWIGTRAAGSGRIPIPCPDIIAGNGKRVLAIECKSVKAKRKYFNDEQLKELKKFSKRFGAEPWIGIKFNNKGWYFLKPKDLGKSKGRHLFVSLDLAIKKGLRFEELIGLFKQLKLR